MGLTPYVKSVALSYMEALSSPRSLTVAILIRYEDWDQLTQLSVDPVHYNSALDFKSAACATGFLKKFNGFKLPIDIEALTLEKWWEAEKQCYRTNERLSPYLFGSNSEKDNGIAIFIARLRRKIRSVIGSRPPASIRGRFGPGATMSDSSRQVTILDKMSSVPTLTPLASLYKNLWEDTYWGRLLQERNEPLSIVPGNGFFLVPKDSRIMRPCAKEPSINSFIQLGIGRAMRDLIKKNAKIDLQEGQSTHRQVACSASKDGRFATIDLSSASDTVCKNLVKLLLPEQWYQLLNSVRSPKTKVKGKWVLLEKFSSMGNGFTFELETLIFWSIASLASYEEDVLVYGDDIICPSQHVDAVLAALKYFGFTPNTKKTFTTGVFRESCGGDFFDGVNVRPYFLKEDPNEPQHFICLANGIRSVFSATDDPGLDSTRGRSTWFRIIDALPSAIRRCRGPQDLGDIVIHDDESQWQIRWRDSIRYIKCYRPARYRVTRLSKYHPDVQYGTALYLAGTPSPPYQYAHAKGSRVPLGLTPRDGVAGYKIGYVAFS